MVYVIIPPPMLQKVNNILTNLFTNIQSKSIDFALLTADFNYFSKILSKNSPKIQIFGPSGPKNCVFLLIICSKFGPKLFTKLGGSSLKNTKYSLCMQLAMTHHQITPPPQCRQEIYAPALGKLLYTTGFLVVISTAVVGSGSSSCLASW